jgi:sulfatase maturation enzyme AslB (radical SAM superfamily)
MTINNETTARKIRDIAISELDTYLHEAFFNSGSSGFPVEIERQYWVLSALLHAVKNNLDKEYITSEALEKLLRIFLYNNSVTIGVQKALDLFIHLFEKHGQHLPAFRVLSPTQSCNLNCKGCYAPSDEKNLSYETVRDIISDVRDHDEDHFIVINGGEPFTYEDSGKTLLDLFEEFNDMFFMVCTNGTRIDEALAQKLVRLGNVSPAILVEGYGNETDERRGPGEYKRVLKAMENLRNAGSAFGISVTVTQKNIDLLLDDHFYDHFFEELGAVYMWQSLMTELTDLVPAFEKRVRLSNLQNRLLKEKKYFIADFWNSATSQEACRAYGWSVGRFLLC